MLERVALGQSRFRTPGVAADERGIALGKRLVLLFTSIEGIVTWLRLYASNESLDEFGEDLRLMSAQTKLKSTVFLVSVPTTSSYTSDNMARIARLAGGVTFTGNKTHFVKYRDEKSPFGYDVPEINMQANAAFLLYDTTHEVFLTSSEDISLLSLITKLSPRQTKGKLFSDGFLAVRFGLADSVIRYLYRNRVAANVALVHPKSDSAFAVTEGYMLVSLQRAPERIIALFESVPGITAFAKDGPRSAVEFGFEHLMRLASCQNVFADGALVLFWGKDKRVDTIPNLESFAPIAKLTTPTIDNAPVIAAELHTAAMEEVKVPLRLGANHDVSKYVAGALVPLEHADQIRRITHFLPGSQLAEYKIAATNHGFLVTHPKTTDPFPLGTLLWEFAIGVLIPLGQELLPRVSATVAAQFLGHEKGLLTVFTNGGQRFQLKASDLVSFERSTLSQMPVAKTVGIDYSATKLAAAEVRNKDLNRFALWGIGPLDEKALPVADD